MTYADIILPLAVDGPLTYAIPPELAAGVRPGAAVVVPLGARKFYTGIVCRLHEQKPATARVRPIASVAGGTAVAGAVQLRFWQWLADYYLCGIGEVMKAALPAALKSAGYTDTIRESYTAKTETHLALHPTLDTEAALNAALDSLGRAKGQQTALVRLAELLRPEGGPQRESYPKSRFTRGGHGSAAVLKALQDKGLILTQEVEVSRHTTKDHADHAPLPVLTEAQQAALDTIRGHFESHKTTLLHGVTGSGKTEIYIHLIDSALRAGRDVLYLLPEIALTTQLIERLQRYFGSRVVVYHSRTGDNLRAERYLDVLRVDREPMLVIGVRSALLLPHHNLGLVVVDEEHDGSYKQADPAPRYQARDAAVVLAGMMPGGADVLLGSATPALESAFNAASGKYGSVTLSERYGGARLPRVTVVDMARAGRRGERVSHFSRLLLDEIGAALEAGEQTILFQNRRGFSPHVECGACGAIPGCPHCNVSLVWHKADGALVCHYCGHTVPAPTTCPTCGAADLQARGFGTEKIEAELAALFPSARIARLDLDATRSASGLARIVSAFDAGRVDILVGTQMVTKGFDFDRVTLVGVLGADNLLGYPDFRATERGFQLLMQVAGRAGRRAAEGRVIVQTMQPDHPALAQVRAGDYRAMFRGQLVERQRFGYPPYTRLVRFTLKHRDKAVLDGAAVAFAAAMRPVFGRRLLGPQTPIVDKVRGEHLTTFLLKIEREKSFAEAKSLARRAMQQLLKHPGHASLTIVADVDPY